MTLIIDSYAWIEILMGSRTGARARQELVADGEPLTPDIVLAEVARKFARDGATDETIRAHLRSVRAASDITPIDSRIALSAALADGELQARSRERGLARPGLADAIVLATGRSWDAKILTGDPHFEGLPETNWIIDQASD